MRLTGFRIRNFKMFRDVSVRNLPPLAIFVGANASGKSTLFDVFRFLRELFSGTKLINVFAMREGFDQVLTRGANKPEIEIALDFLTCSENRSDGGGEAEYLIRFRERDGLPMIAEEKICIRNASGNVTCKMDSRRNTGRGHAYPSIDFEQILQTGNRQKKHLQFAFLPDTVPVISIATRSLSRGDYPTELLSLCRFVDDMFVAKFESIPVRKSAKATGIDRLSKKGKNLALVAKKIHENNPDKFESAVGALRRCVPEIKTVEPMISEDGYAFLRFTDRNFDRSFNSRAMSDGTVLAFAYLLLFADAKEKLICIDEIERSLYPGILRHLLIEMRKYAQTGSSQVIVSTHSPDLLNYAELDEVFWLAKKDGYTQIHRAKDDEEVSAFVENGDLPGWVWRKGLFAGADPESEVE